MERDFKHNPMRTVEFPVITTVQSLFKTSGNKPMTMETLIYEVQSFLRHQERFTDEELSKTRFLVEDLLLKRILEDAGLTTVQIAEPYWQALKLENELFHRTVPDWPEVTDWKEEEGE